MAINREKIKRNAAASVIASFSERTEDEKDRVVVLDMSLIDENPDNDTVFNMDGIEAFSKSIEEYGFSGAIEVFKKPNGRYEISSGHRRFRAMKQAGKKDIPCIICENTDDKDKAVRLLLSNIHNRVLTGLDWGRSIVYFCTKVSDQHEVNAASRAEAMEFFGFSKSQVSRYLALTKLEPELIFYAQQKDFPLYPLSIAAGCTREQQLKLRDYIEDRFTAIKKELPEDETAEYSQITKNELVNALTSIRGGIKERSTNRPKPKPVSADAEHEPVPAEQNDGGYGDEDYIDNDFIMLDDASNFSDMPNEEKHLSSKDMSIISACNKIIENLGLGGTDGLDKETVLILSELRDVIDGCIQ